MNATARLTRPLTASQLLDEIFRQPRAASAERAMPMDFYESDASYIVRASIPGFSKEQVSIEVQNSTLTISAVRQASVPEGFETLVSGALPLSISRSVALPETVDSERAEATFANGVLELALPKHASSKKTVKIN